MKMSRSISLSTLLLLFLTASFLIACQTGREKDSQNLPEHRSSAEPAKDLSSMQLSMLPLSDETKEIVSLIDTHASSQLYRYQMDDTMKELHFFVEEFKDGKLTCLAQTGGPAPGNGVFAILTDPDEITLSWNGGKYSRLIDSTSVYRLSSSKRQEFLSGLKYNEKTVLFMIACSRSDTLEAFDLTDYRDLLSLEEKKFDRILFVTAAFTDFDVAEELASWNGIVRDKAKLSQETLQWLENYNKMDRLSQLSLSYIPIEFIQLDNAAGDIDAKPLALPAVTYP